mgnify:CR=1 FL=1
MKKKVTIIDYGLGNIVSAQQSFLRVVKENKINANITISSDPSEIDKSSHVVLPGQGAFKSCIGGLSGIPGMINALNNNILDKKKPFLGICVGMQLLADIGYENGNHKGLGWIKGSVKKISSKNLKLPHMGWNEVGLTNNNFKLNFETKNKDYYFVHSYFFECMDKKNIVALTNYGVNFPSIVAKENIYGVQFHPEKSSDQGLQLIKQFLLL